MPDAHPKLETEALAKLVAIPHASLKLADGSADQEFRGQDPLAEGHLGMMQALEKHLHTGFAYFFLVDADGGKRGIHQNGFFAVIEADQADFVWDFHPALVQRSPESVGDFVVAGNNGSGSQPPGKDAPYTPLTEIAETQRISGSNQDRF